MRANASSSRGWATGGWRLFTQWPLARDQVTLSEPATLDDGGAIAAWLAARDVDAVRVRPDHYVFGTSRGAQGAADLVARRDALIAGTTPQEIAA